MTKGTLSIVVLGAFAALSLAPRPARAEFVYVRPAPNPFARPHFYMGAEVVGVAVVGETGPRSFLDHGGGFNLFVGGRINRVFALELGWQPTFHNNQTDIFGERVSTVGLDALTVDGKFYPLYGPIQPYLTVGAGLYLLGDNFSVLAEGPGYQIGAGIDFWITRHVSLGLKAQYRGVALVDYDVFRDNTYLSLITGSGNLTVRF
ncbi:MAG TPA: outer membrane beta-barrel protein [Polyangia bacterium]|nr:outer membrane beta-barrel protein [Polyangia bacterium]